MKLKPHDGSLDRKLTVLKCDKAAALTVPLSRHIGRSPACEGPSASPRGGVLLAVLRPCQPTNPACLWAGGAGSNPVAPATVRHEATSVLAR